MTMINAGDTAWMLFSAALVFLMTPGLAFFYGGLIHKKNISSILMPYLMVVCIVSLQWVLFGYSLSFGPDHNGWIGTLDRAGLRGMGGEPNIEYSSTIPQQAFMIYHAVVAIIPLALVLGAFAERVKFSALCLFAFLWTTLVYDPVAHWMWAAGGFLRNAGALDFSGGTVVHMNAGLAALAMVLVLGQHEESSPNIPPQNNLPFAVLGAGILWFGWFGLSTGSALGAGGLAAGAFAATHIAAAAAGLTWVILDWILNKQPTLIGLITGAVSGLVAITPAAGFVTIGGSIGIGFMAAGLLYLAFFLIEKKFGYEDSIYVIGMHGIGGMWGMIATGLWATKTANPNGTDGLFYGNFGQLLIQIKAILATGLYSFAMAYLILKAVEMLIGLRIPERLESPNESDEAGHPVGVR